MWEALIHSFFLSVKIMMTIIMTALMMLTITILIVVIITLITMVIVRRMTMIETTVLAGSEQ